MNFKQDGTRTVDFEYSDDEIHFLRKNWQSYIKKIPEYNKDEFSGKGIVYTAGGVKYTTCVWVSIKTLRKLGCTLPIELWYLRNEISNDVIEKFKELNVICRDFDDIEKTSMRGYMLKPLAIIYSSFKEILFLDADNICTLDPSPLFDLEEYKKFGTVFWPDFWHTCKSNSIWKIIGTSRYDIPEQESGQILIDKERCWKELHLCLYFNKFGDYYYRILLGDKDTFKFSWLALNKEFYMVPFMAGSCGYELNGSFYGNTMVQHHPNGEVGFLHRNLLKWDITHKNELVWKKIKKFTKEAKNKQIKVSIDENYMYHIDLGGDYIEVNFENVFCNLESECLSFLSEWRESSTYKEFLEYSYFANERYRSKKLFSL